MNIILTQIELIPKIIANKTRMFFSFLNRDIIPNIRAIIPEIKKNSTTFSIALHPIFIPEYSTNIIKKFPKSPNIESINPSIPNLNHILSILLPKSKNQLFCLNIFGV
mgnify:CR=1 FL=1